MVEEPFTPDVQKTVQAQPMGNNTTGIMDEDTKPEAKAPVETPLVEVQAEVPVGETLPGEVPETPALTPWPGRDRPGENESSI
jgi:hypothetical protein